MKVVLNILFTCFVLFQVYNSVTSEIFEYSDKFLQTDCLRPIRDCRRKCIESNLSYHPILAPKINVTYPNECLAYCDNPLTDQIKREVIVPKRHQKSDDTCSNIDDTCYNDFKKVCDAAGKVYPNRCVYQLAKQCGKTSAELLADDVICDRLIEKYAS